MTQKALIYCRVSDKSQSVDGSGLTSQEHRCRAYAAQQGYDVEAVFPDDFTGGGNFMNRPGMVAMLGYLKAMQGESYVIIFDDLKRLARDTKYYLILKGELAALNARVECLNFTFDDSPEGAFYETIIAAGGELERKQNARQVRQKIKARFEAGFWATNAPLGYKMQTERGKPRVLIRDEPIASYIQEALEGFAAGRFQSQAEIKRFLERCPDFPQTPTKGVHTDTVKRFLVNPVYAGLVEMKSWGITLREGQHDGLICVETFQKVQQRLAAKPIAPAKKNISADFPLRGAVTCADCGKYYTGAWSKGRNKYHPYYSCANRSCISFGKSIRRADMEGAFARLLRRLQPSKPLLVVATKMFEKHWAHLGDVQKQKNAACRAQCKQLEAQKQRLINKLIETDNVSVTQACEKRLAQIEREETLKAAEMAQMGDAQRDYSGQLRTALLFLANPLQIWASGKIEYQRSVLRLAFSKPLIYDRFAGFRTAAIASPFRLLEGFCDQDTRMVDAAGLEPATLAL